VSSLNKKINIQEPTYGRNILGEIEKKVDNLLVMKSRHFRNIYDERKKLFLTCIYLKIMKITHTSATTGRD
jgi:hypothetical protein